MRDTSTTSTQCAICDVEGASHTSTQHTYTSWAQLEAAHTSAPSEPAGLVEARYVNEWRPY